MQLSYSSKSVIKTRVWEDNNGALALATNPTKISVHTKHMAIKYYFFISSLVTTFVFLRLIPKNNWQTYLPRIYHWIPFKT